MLDLTFVPASIAAAVPLSWAALIIAFRVTDLGRVYWDVPTREDAVKDIANSQPTAISIAALVFAGLAFVGTNQRSARLSDLLLVSLACFVILYAIGFWPWSFSAQIAGDAFEWTGLAVFLAAVYEYAIVVAPGVYGHLAVVVAAIAVLLLSTRAAYAHWHNAVAIRDARKSEISPTTKTCP